MVSRSQLRLLALLNLAAGLLAGCASITKEPRWVSLFDGKTLKGWKQLDGEAKFEVRDGAIVGTVTKDVTMNSFLVTEEEFEDFVFECEFKIDPAMAQGSSGVQFRSRPAGATTRRLHGYQYEIDPGTRGLTGGVQEEGGSWRRSKTPAEIQAELARSPTARPTSFWLAPSSSGGAAAEAWRNQHGNQLKSGEWNVCRIEARGPHIKTWLNGHLLADFEDTSEIRIPRGFFGLQVHETKDEKYFGKTVAFRNIRVQRLKK